MPTMTASPTSIAVEAIRIRKNHEGFQVFVDVQVAGEDFFRNAYSEEIVDGTLISHEVLPLGILAGDKLDF